MEEHQEQVEGPLEDFAELAENGAGPYPHYGPEQIEATRAALLLWLRDQAEATMRAVGDDLATQEQVAAMVEIAAAFERAHRTEQ